MSEELKDRPKPCPWCGEVPMKKKFEGAKLWYVKCDTIKCPGSGMPWVALVKWNTRPALDGDKELVEAFSELTKSILDNVTLEYMDEMTEGRMTKAIDAILAVKD